MPWLPDSRRFRSLRHALAIGHDTVAAGLSFLIALYLRWSDDMFIYAREYIWQGMIVCGAVAMGFILYARLYRRLWRYVSLKDIATIFKICAATLVVFYALLFLTMRLELMPRSVPLLHGMVLLLLLCAPRFLSRALHERRLKLPHNQQVPVLLVGATSDAELFIRESLRSSSFSYRVVGVVGTEGYAGYNIHHVRVYGQIKDIPGILRKLRRNDNAPQRIVLTDPLLDGAQVRDLLVIAEAEGLPVARMPRLGELTRGDRSKFDIKPVAVEDILGRPQARLDQAGMRAVIEGQMVLVTGAGGSIGSELVRQAASYNPASIILFDNGEYNLYAIDRELQERFPDLPRYAVLGDVRDQGHVRQLFAKHRPGVVFHAAALKHVPLCEINIEEAILTNVVGTRYVADACVEAGVPVMVQISTDKAVHPTNVMGACKRIGESYCQALGQEHVPTRFITVRFGNVLGSTGSVVPLFQRQLERGGPLTVTHKEMTRYFMTIREAVQLVIQAAALGLAQNDQQAPIYVLDMGEPVRIEDLALQMIRLAGLRPYEDIDIVFTGLRPGEKLHEELFYDSEPLINTGHDSIRLAQARRVDGVTMRQTLDGLEEAAIRRHRDESLQLLKQLAPDYRPQPQEDAKKAG